MTEAQDENVKSFDPKAWHEHELKVRDINYKASSDATKLAIEFSKLIVTNLIWINAAGLGSLPVMAKFIGLDGGGWEEKRHFLLYPGTAFASGLFMALLCAFATYLNLSEIAKVYGSLNLTEISVVRQQHHEYSNNAAYKSIIDDVQNSAQNAVSKAQSWAQRYYIAGIVLGFVSFISFAIACYLLVTIEAD